MSRETDDLFRDIINGLTDGQQLPPLPHEPPPEHLLRRGQRGEYHSAASSMTQPRRGSDGVARPRMPSPTKHSDALPSSAGPGRREYIASPGFQEAMRRASPAVSYVSNPPSPAMSPSRVPQAASQAGQSPVGSLAQSQRSASYQPPLPTSSPPKRVDRSHVRTPVTVVTESKDTPYALFRGDPHEFRATENAPLQVTKINTTNPGLYEGGRGRGRGRGRSMVTSALDPAAAYQSALRAQRRVKPSEDPTRDRSPQKGVQVTAVPQNVYDREWHRDPYVGINAGRSPYDSVHVLGKEKFESRGDHPTTAIYDPGPHPAFAEAIDAVERKRYEDEMNPSPGILGMGVRAAQYKRDYRHSGQDFENRNTVRAAVVDVDTLVDQLQLQPTDDDGRSFVVSGDFLLNYNGDDMVEQSEDSSIYDEDETFPQEQYHQELMVFREQMLYYRKHHPEEYPKYLEEVINSGLPREHFEHFRREQVEIQRSGGVVPEILAKRRKLERRKAFPEPCLDPTCTSRFRSQEEMLLHVQERHPRIADQIRKERRERDERQLREQERQRKLEKEQNKKGGKKKPSGKKGKPSGPATPPASPGAKKKPTKKQSASPAKKQKPSAKKGKKKPISGNI